MKVPQFVAVLHRKLKADKSYDDFYEAWLPPGLKGKDPRKEAVGYFPGPMQVINAVNSEDPTDIISIGLIWGTGEQMQAALERNKSAEASRSIEVSKVADKSQPNKIYIVQDVNQLGTAFSEE